MNDFRVFFFFPKVFDPSDAAHGQNHRIEVTLDVAGHHYRCIFISFPFPCVLLALNLLALTARCLSEQYLSPKAAKSIFYYPHKMCEQCVKEEYPDRGRMCLDTGSYLLNYQGCVQCQHKDTLEIVNRVAKEDEDGEELVTFQHKCTNCDHLIANHEYSFKVNGDYQEYEMECRLCGRAEDRISIMPDDPRLQNDIY